MAEIPLHPAFEDEGVLTNEDIEAEEENEAEVFDEDIDLEDEADGVEVEEVEEEDNNVIPTARRNPVNLNNLPGMEGVDAAELARREAAARAEEDLSTRVVEESALPRDGDEGPRDGVPRAARNAGDDDRPDRRGRGDVESELGGREGTRNRRRRRRREPRPARRDGGGDEFEPVSLADAAAAVTGGGGLDSGTTGADTRRRERTGADGSGPGVVNAGAGAGAGGGAGDAGRAGDTGGGGSPPTIHPSIAASRTDPALVAAYARDSFFNYFSNATDGNPLLGKGLRMTGDVQVDFTENDIPENVEGMVYLGMAYVSADFPGTAVKWDIGCWNDMKITVKFPRKYSPETSTTTGALTRGENSPNGYPASNIPAKASGDEYGCYNADNINLCPDIDAREMFNTIYNGLTDWKQYFIDLLNAYQVKGLTAKNVSSYNKSKKSHDLDGEFIAQHFGKLTGGAPKVSDNDAYRSLLTKGQWTEYRSNFATITGVIKRMLDELPPRYKTVFSATSINLVNNSLKKPHCEETFRKIPSYVLAYAYVWNEVAKLNFKGLWSGKRAYEQLTTSQRLSMKNWLKEALSKIKHYETSRFPWGSEMPDSLKSV